MNTHRSNTQSFGFESLESRRVLSTVPVLLQQFPNNDWRAASATDNSRSPTVAWSSLANDGKTVAIADFTADGVDDVLMQWPDGSLQLQINDGRRLFQIPWGDGPSTDAELLKITDTNNDGLDDLVSFDRATGDIWVSLNSMDGFVSEVWSNFTPQADWLELFVDDFNGDGRIDVLGFEAGGGFWLAKNVGDTFHNHYWGAFSTISWEDVVSGDFTGDGLPDVAARAADNTWWMWQGETTGMLAADYRGHWKMQDAWHDVQVADFDGDLRDDILGRTEDGRLWVATSKSDRFHTWAWGKGWSHGANWSEVQVLDLNGDDLPDQLGRAADNTWWYAENLGGRFVNRFLTKHAGPTKVSTNFVRSDAVNLEGTFRQIIGNLGPGESRHGGFSTQSTDGVSASVNEEGYVVLAANNLDLLGVELESSSGSLIPVPDGDANPFQFLLSNTSTRITFGSLSAINIDGSVVLGVGWDSSTGVRDLKGTWGSIVDGEPPISLLVDDQLDGGQTTEQLGNFESENLRLYLGWRSLKNAATD